MTVSILCLLYVLLYELLNRLKRQKNEFFKFNSEWIHKHNWQKQLWGCFRTDYYVNEWIGYIVWALIRDWLVISKIYSFSIPINKFKVLYFYKYFHLYFYGNMCRVNMPNFAVSLILQYFIRFCITKLEKETFNWGHAIKLEKFLSSLSDKFPSS